MVDWEAVPHIDQVRIIGALLLLVFERVPSRFTTTSSYVNRTKTSTCKNACIRLKVLSDFTFISPISMRLNVVVYIDQVRIIGALLLLVFERVPSDYIYVKSKYKLHT